MSRASVAGILSAFLLGGCGGSSSTNGNAEKQVTAPPYNGYPAITIPVTSGTPAQCRREAQVFSRNAVSFLAPFPSDSDTYLVVARLQFFEFEVTPTVPIQEAVPIFMKTNAWVDSVG